MQHTRARLWLKASAAVIAYDLVASLVSKYADIPYGWFSIGSFIIYFVIGFAAYRVVGFASAMLITAAAGGVDATVGWLMSWAIGPGNPQAKIAVVELVAAMITVAIGAAITGALGAAASRLTRGKRGLTTPGAQ